MLTETYNVTKSARWLVSCVVAMAVLYSAMSGQQAPSILGVVHKAGWLQPVSHVEVRIEGAGAAQTSDSGEFALPMTASLHVGMAAVFHVKDWLIVKPCELKSGRTYLRDPSAEPIEFLVLARSDPKLKSPTTKEAMKMIECLLEEQASEFAPKPKPSGAPRSSLPHEGHPVFAGQIEKEYAVADPKSLCENCFSFAAVDPSDRRISPAGATQDIPTRQRWAKWKIDPSPVGAAEVLTQNLKFDNGAAHYYLMTTGYHPAVSQGPSDLPADTANDEFLAKKAKELGFSVEELKSAITVWAKSVEDPYQKGLAALHELRYQQASQYISASIPSPPGAFLERYVPLARAEYEQGHYPAAEVALRKVLAVHSDDPVVLNNLALALAAQAKYSEAEPLYKRALAIDEKVLGPEHPEVGTLLNNMGTLYIHHGKYSEAEPLLKRALTIDENTFGPDHPASATILNNLGMLYHAEGDTLDATRSYRRSLAIQEKAGGPDNPALANTLSNMAESLLYWEGALVAANEEEGERLLTRALAIDEKALGPDHPKVAIDLARLGFLHVALGKSSEGYASLKRALAIDEKALGPDHPEVASLLNNWGLLYYYEGKYSEAESLFKRAYTIEEKSLGPNHPYLAITADSLAKTLRKLGRYPEADAYEKRAKAIRAKRKQ